MALEKGRRRKEVRLEFHNLEERKVLSWQLMLLAAH